MPLKKRIFCNKFCFEIFFFFSLADNEIWEMMRSYTTFLIARHPFERLVSAFYDKLTNKAAYNYYRKTVGKQIAKHQISEYLSDIKIR